MKYPIKVLVTVGTIISPAFIASIVPLPGIQTEGIHVYAALTETFEKAETDIIDKSKEVIKKETEAWKKDLKSDVKTAIDSICKESDLKTITKINTELRQGDETKSKDTIEKIDAALRTAPVTKENTKIYIDVSLKNDFGVAKESVTTGETVITENGYIKGGLARNTSASTSEVIELTIPKGEHMANMTASGSTTISYNELLERGRSFVITAKKEIKDMGKTRTKIEAKLLPKEYAKKVSNENYQKWMDSLGGYEKNILANLTPSLLKSVNLDIEKYRENEQLRDKFTSNLIADLDKFLKEENFKLPQAVYVYKTLRDTELGYTPTNEQESSFYENGTNKINKDKFNKLQNELEYGNFNHYMITNFIQPEQDKATPVLLELKVPEGMPVFYLDENSPVLARDYGIVYKSMNIEVLPNQTKEIIKIEGEIVPKQEIQEKIQQKEYELNETLREKFNTLRRIIKLDVDGFYASSVAQRSVLLMNQLVESIPKELLSQGIKQMNEYGAFIFTDKPLSNYDYSLEDNVMGIYQNKTRQLYVQMNNPDLVKNNRSVEILMHEFGHAIDALLLNYTSESFLFQHYYNEYFDKYKEIVIDIMKKLSNEVSEESEIKQLSENFLRGTLTSKERESNQNIIRDVRKSLQDIIIKDTYMFTDSGEMFAELFAFMFMDPDSKTKSERLFPEGVQFIEQRLNAIK
ncbi:TPA: hypothetical protein ROY17_004783 [Bacillus thuringiensis]|nr:hypothetical protein [Bacillus thuringiensis]